MEFCGKKTTTTLRLFKAAQLCFLSYHHPEVLALKDLSLQRWKLVFVQALDKITTQSNQRWLLRIAGHADHLGDNRINEGPLGGAYNS